MSDRLIGRIDKIRRNAQQELEGTLMGEDGEFYAWSGMLGTVSHGDIVSFRPGIQGHSRAKRPALELDLVTEDHRSMEQFTKFVKFMRESIR